MWPSLSRIVAIPQLRPLRSPSGSRSPESSFLFRCSPIPKTWRIYSQTILTSHLLLQHTKKKSKHGRMFLALKSGTRQSSAPKMMGKRGFNESSKKSVKILIFLRMIFWHTTQSSRTPSL
jgi:hypothetical protein